MIECLLCECKVLSSNSSPTRKKKFAYSFPDFTKCSLTSRIASQCSKKMFVYPHLKCPKLLSFMESLCYQNQCFRKLIVYSYIPTLSQFWGIKSSTDDLHLKIITKL
jgi:hypothetical protein